MSRRSKLTIVYEILTIIADFDNVKITNLSRQANLSHYEAIAKTEQLINVHLIKKEGRFFKLTILGVELLKSMNTFKSKIAEFGLEL